MVHLQWLVREGGREGGREKEGSATWRVLQSLSFSLSLSLCSGNRTSQGFQSIPPVVWYRDWLCARNVAVLGRQRYLLWSLFHVDVDILCSMSSPLTPHYPPLTPHPHRCCIVLYAASHFTPSASELHRHGNHTLAPSV